MDVVKTKYRGTVKYFLVFSELIQAARYRGTVTYQELAKVIGLPFQGAFLGNEVGKVLGEISEDEVKAGSPMLSALAVDIKGKPGKGFFTLAKQLGRQKIESDKDFWDRECDIVYDTWRVLIKKPINVVIYGNTKPVSVNDLPAQHQKIDRTKADQIRYFVIEKYISAARSQGLKVIRLKAGNVHKDMNFFNRMPAVCQVLDGKKFFEMAHVSLLNRQGPNAGSNVFWTFELK